MRTTLNLDDDVAHQLSDLARRSGRSVSRTANEVLRAGLVAGQHPKPMPTYEPPVFDTGRPLLDVTDVGAALERLDVG
jgi:hypothetical protein